MTNLAEKIFIIASIAGIAICFAGLATIGNDNAQTVLHLAYFAAAVVMVIYGIFTVWR